MATLIKPATAKIVEFNGVSYTCPAGKSALVQGSILFATGGHDTSPFSLKPLNFFGGNFADSWGSTNPAGRWIFAGQTISVTADVAFIPRALWNTWTTWTVKASGQTATVTLSIDGTAVTSITKTSSGNNATSNYFYTSSVIIMEFNSDNSK